MEDLQISNHFIIKSHIRDTYSVEFISDVKSHISHLSEKNNTVFIIDEIVSELFQQEIGDLHRQVKLSCSENNKTLDYAKVVIRELIGKNIRKDDTLVVIGGGISQDIGAFIASVLFRGIEWKFYPTTLLAQCDSCIGSKSSINFDLFKNLLGTFNPPSEIFIYDGFLETLAESEIKSGIGEMLHYFFTTGITLAREVAVQFDQLLVQRSLLSYFIKKSLQIKKNIIEIDEFDTSVRHIFNYGHTFGHAIESITEYRIPHGQAVTIGMDIANFISLSIGMIDQENFDSMHEILVKNIVSFKLNENNISEYMEALSKDKKNKGVRLGCILTHGPGNVEKIFVELDDSLKQLLLGYSFSYGK